MVEFLELNVSKELCKEIADKCQFERMKKDKRGLECEHWRTVWRDNNPNYFRKGTYIIQLRIQYAASQACNKESVNPSVIPRGNTDTIENVYANKYIYHKHKFRQK